MVSSPVSVRTGPLGVRMILRTITPGAIQEALAAGSATGFVQKLVEAFPGAWFFTRKDGTFAYVNHGASRMHGYEPAELLRHTIFDVNPTLTPELWLRLNEMSQDNTGIIRTLHRRKDGSQFPVEAVGARLVLDGEELALAYVVDLSDEQAVKEQLAEKEHLLETVLGEAPVALWRMDIACELELASGPLWEALGVGAEHLGLPIERGLGGCAPLALASKRALLEGAQEGVVEVGERFFEYRVSLARDGQGAIRGATGVLIEITRRHLAETAQRRLEERLGQAKKMDAIGLLAGGVAHDFNNLLQVISSSAELGAKEESREILDTYLENIIDACGRAQRLVDQLLSVGRCEPRRSERVVLDVLVTEMLPILQRLVGARIRLHCDLPSAPVVLEADSTQIEQMLLNLVVNARDAIVGEGLVSVRIGRELLSQDRAELLGVAAGPYGVLEVADTGPGVSAKIRERIFEPFFTTKPLGQGTGLGLATTYAMVTEHGGAIDLDSTAKGAVFRIFLPAISAGAS